MFGPAVLGDVRRNRRVVSMVAAVAERPGGTIAAVFDDPAELAGAYDLVENDAVAPSALAEAIARDAAERARRYFFVWVATDGTSVTVTDRTQSKGVDARQKPLESGPLDRRYGFAAQGALPPYLRAFLAGFPPPIPG